MANRGATCSYYCGTKAESELKAELQTSLLSLESKPAQFVELAREARPDADQDAALAGLCEDIEELRDLASKRDLTLLASEVRARLVASIGQFARSCSVAPGRRHRGEQAGEDHPLFGHTISPHRVGLQPGRRGKVEKLSCGTRTSDGAVGRLDEGGPLGPRCDPQTVAGEHVADTYFGEWKEFAVWGVPFCA